MIESDRHVAGAGQQFGSRLALHETLFGARERRLGYEPLMTFHPGHMGIAEQRDAIRVKLDGARDGFRERRHGLMRQAVHQIEIDAGDFRFAEPRHDTLGELETLYAANGLLDAFIEILHAEAGPGDTELRQHHGVAMSHGARIDLDGNFGVRREAEFSSQQLREFAEIRRRQHGRGATAPMQVR